MLNNMWVKQCGLYRTGTLWAHSALPVECHPDIVTVAKPLANGYPIGAVLLRDSVASTMTAGECACSLITPLGSESLVIARHSWYNVWRIAPGQLLGTSCPLTNIRSLIHRPYRGNQRLPDKSPISATKVVPGNLRNKCPRSRTHFGTWLQG